MTPEVEPGVGGRGCLVVVVGLFVALVVLPIVALALPKLLVDDGLDGLTRAESAAARAAIEVSHLTCLDNPIGRALTLATRVTSVRPVGAGSDVTTVWPGTEALAGFEVTFEVYTVFAVRLSTCTIAGTA